MFSGVFGKRAPPPPAAAPRVAVDMSELTAKFAKRVSDLEKKIRAQDAIIASTKREALARVAAGDRAGAARLFHSYKLAEAARDKSHAFVLNVQTMQGAVAAAADNVAQADITRAGAAGLRAAQAALNPDAISDMVAEMEDAMGELKEAEDVLAQPIAGGGARADEADVEATLAAWAAEAAGAAAAPPAAAAAYAPPPAAAAYAAAPPSAADAPYVPPHAMPALPTGVPGAAPARGARTMDDELAELA